MARRQRGSGLARILGGGLRGLSAGARSLSGNPAAAAGAVPGVGDLADFGSLGDADMDLIGGAPTASQMAKLKQLLQMFGK